MSIFVDVLLIAIFLFFVIMFSKKGFAQTAKDIGKAWLSVFCSMFLGPWVAGKMETLFLRNAITVGINNTLTNLVENNANGYDLAQLFANLPEGFVRFLENNEINFAQLEAEYGSSTYASAEIIQAISQRLATPCIEMVSSIIGHVVCFVVPLLFFAWLRRKLENKEEHRFLNYADHVSGFFVGAISGYCAALGVAVVLYTVFQLVVCFDAHSAVVSVYNNSYIFKFLNEFNTLEFLKRIFFSLI